MNLLYETSLYLLPFPAKIMHKAFVNMVLTEEDEMVAPSLHLQVTSKWAANNTKLLDKEMYSTKKYILGSPCFGRGDPFLNCVYTFVLQYIQALLCFGEIPKYTKCKGL